MRSIMRRGTGERYEESLTGLAEASSIEAPTREELTLLNHKRKKRVSKRDWPLQASPDRTGAKV